MGSKLGKAGRRKGKPTGVQTSDGQEKTGKVDQIELRNTYFVNNRNVRAGGIKTVVTEEHASNSKIKGISAEKIRQSGPRNNYVNNQNISTGVTGEHLSIPKADVFNGEHIKGINDHRFEPTKRNEVFIKRYDMQMANQPNDKVCVPCDQIPRRTTTSESRYRDYCSSYVSNDPLLNDRSNVVTDTSLGHRRQCPIELDYKPVRKNMSDESAFEAEIRRKKDVLVVAAIDFGTCFSGYAYSLCQEYKQDHNKINTFTWNSGYGVCPYNYKTRTAILFDKDEKFHSFGYDAERIYAQMLEDQTPAGYRFFKNFKMELYQAEINSKRFRGQRRISQYTMLKDEQNKPMSALTVFSETIKYLKDHLLGCMQKAGIALQTNEIHWILTIPAIWKDDAKQFMRETATRAGIPNAFLTLAYEPEAAAIYCKELSLLKNDSQNRNIGTLKNGNQFLVLDCGGGTVDITSYHIMDDSCLRELESPSGGPWGGNTVNEEYFNFLKHLFGQNVWKTFEKDFPEDALDFKEAFESKKKTIVLSSTSWIPMRYPQSLIPIIARYLNDNLEDVLRKSKYSQSVIGERDKIRFRNDLLTECFIRPVTHITEHLMTLLGRIAVKEVKTIFMVGGFSECDILYTCIKNAFPDVNVIRPPDPMLAILKGAVMFGNNPGLIRERICPRTYGISVNEPFNPNKHNASFKTIIEGQEKCSDIFKTIVKKGDPIVVGSSVFAVECYPTRSTDLVAAVEVYESNLKDPVYTVGESVRKLGVIILDIPDIERGKYRLITIQMHFGITELYVTVKEGGTKNAKVSKFDCLST